jgi:hypothetical protein
VAAGPVHTHTARDDPSAVPKVPAALPAHCHDTAAPAVERYWPAAHGEHTVDAVPPTSPR